MTLISNGECFINSSSVLSRFVVLAFGIERFATWSLTLAGVEVVVGAFDKCPFSTIGEVAEGRRNIGHVQVNVSCTRCLLDLCVT